MSKKRTSKHRGVKLIVIAGLLSLVWESFQKMPRIILKFSNKLLKA